MRFAGIEKDAGMQGEALQKTWLEEKPLWRDKFFYEHRFEHPGTSKIGSLISLVYKFINYYELPDSSKEFYDLRNDPEEVRNLINSSEYYDQIKQYELIMDSIRLTVK